MIDGGLKDIRTNNWCASDGCSTCGWGRKYVTEVDFILTNSTFSIEFSDSNVIDQGFLLKFFMNKMEEIKQKTEQEFRDWVTNALTEFKEREL